MTLRRRNGTWRLIGGVLAASVVVGLAACDDDDGLDLSQIEAAVDDDALADEEVLVDIDDSDGDGSSGAGDPSDGGASNATDDGDFPIPIPDGLVLDVLADSGITMSGQRQLYYEDDDYDRVVAFYEDWTSQSGEWARGEAEGTISFVSLDVDDSALITIIPDQDPGAQADGPVTAVLLVADE